MLLSVQEAANWMNAALEVVGAAGTAECVRRDSAAKACRAAWRAARAAASDRKGSRGER